MTTIAIVQSSYIPWKGYFELMARSDVFVLYDCVQYTARDWRNRNRIKTAQGLHWLTVPVVHESQKQRIADTMVAEGDWARVHWESLRHHYAQSAHFGVFADRVERLYATCRFQRLTEVNRHFLEGINAMLGIATPLYVQEAHVGQDDSPSGRLLAICRAHGATRYLSGPKAKAYLDVGLFEKAGVAVEWMAYDYPEYPQLHGAFEHGVTMLDMLFNTGEAWADYMTPRFPRRSTLAAAND